MSPGDVGPSEVSVHEAVWNLSLCIHEPGVRNRVNQSMWICGGIWVRTLMVELLPLRKSGPRMQSNSRRKE